MEVMREEGGEGNHWYVEDGGWAALKEDGGGGG